MNIFDFDRTILEMMKILNALTIKKKQLKVEHHLLILKEEFIKFE